ncbi:MAG: hypothetical protein HOV80_39490 [Polyangiaceae bacterium]|nr:hypothetical protein [Polyangiaceae bacterium]
MSIEVWFRGRLEFADDDAVDAANEELEDEGCNDTDDNEIKDDLKWSGTVLTIDSRGSMPSSCYDISAMVLSIYARHAKSGEMLAVDIENGVGERYPAGSDGGDELEDDEVDELREEYGWEA